MMAFRLATAADLDAIAGIYDAVHAEEEAGRDDNADGPNLPCSPMRRDPSSSLLRGRWVQ